MRTKRVGLVVLLLLPMTAACNLLTPLIFVGEHKKKVSPEFDKLANGRVAVLVWTDQSTLFDFPYARFELATYIGDKLSAEMAQRSLKLDVVPTQHVEDFLQKDLDAQIDPDAVGKEFDVDYVVYVEVLEFQVRDPDQPQLLRGTINASVTVYDIRAEPGLAETFELAPVYCTYPESGPVLMTATNSPQIREQTYHKFSELVARKFYEYTVDL